MIDALVARFWNRLTLRAWCLVLLIENTVTYRRTPGPPLGRLAPPTLRAGTRCRLARTPGRPPQTGGPTPCRETAQGVPAGTGLAGYTRAAWVWRGVSDRSGGPGSSRL